MVHGMRGHADAISENAVDGQLASCVALSIKIFSSACFVKTYESSAVNATFVLL